MGPDNACVSLWRDLRSRDTNLILRVGATVTLAALLGGLAILGSSAIVIGTDFRVDAEPIAVSALTISAVLWLVSLWLIWRRVRRGGAFVAPLVVTLVIGTLTGVGLFVVDEVVRHVEELVGTGLLLSAGALIVFVWTSTWHRLLRGKPVLGRDGQVNVRCPSCGYSLIGLTELRCPECGTRFTIDELIRAQDYARPRRPPTAEPAQPAEA
jgi:uncharacterized C2H2 Zn-finger protein